MTDPLSPQDHITAYWDSRSYLYDLSPGHGLQKEEEHRLWLEALRNILPDYEAVRGDDLELGRALHREMDKALALSHGILSHSGAGMAEAFRRQGPFRLERLL